MTPAVVHIDVETRSRADLKKVGAYSYARHPSTEITVLCYAFDDGPVHFWVPFPDLPATVYDLVKPRMEEGSKFSTSPRPPAPLVEHLTHGGQWAAHNAAFERAVLSGPAGRRLGFPALPIETAICTMAKCSNHGLSASLEEAAKCLGTHGKDKAGQNDMRLLCKPKKDGSFHTFEECPERWASLFLYCADDVRAERDLDDHIPDLSANEQRVYCLDQLINDRGVAVDLKAIDDAIVLIEQYKDQLSGECTRLTGVGPTKVQQLAEWVRSNGWPQLPDMQAQTVIDTVAEPACPDVVKRVLRLYSTYNMKAVTKYDAMLRAVCDDGRLRGMLQYYGAGTGRWSSRIVQLQNLYRPAIDDTDTAVEAFSAWDLDWIRGLYPGIDPMKVLASCIRSVLVPAAGHDLIAADYSSIESRVNAWFAGQEDKLAIFRGHGKIYEHNAAGIFKKPIDAIKKGSHERLVGKIAELALGFQGGKGAFAKMAKQQGLKVTEAEAEVYKQEWRAANPKIVQFWYDLEAAAVAAVRNAGAIYKVAGGRIMFKVEGRWLYMRLPSGRRLAYFSPSLNEDERIRFYGIDTHTRRWCWTTTYGGKLCENAVQATSRDLLVHGLFNLQTAGYPFVLTVHDEMVAEVREGWGSVAEVEEIMCRLPKWAEGLPVGAEGWRGKRYRK